MVRETITYELFDALDLPASRTGYAFVRLNNEIHGLYLNVETLDEIWWPCWFESHPLRYCDVSRHRRQMSRDIVDTSRPSDRLVVTTGIERQPADQLAGSGIEHADVAIGDEQLDRLALVRATEPDVVQL